MTRFSAVCFLGCWIASAGVIADSGYALYRSNSAFEDVLDGLKAAIQERGMYINNVMDMGGMLERTGKDLGLNERIYTQAQSVEFCGALLSREMTAEDPARIVNCPFIISVYRRADDPDTTYLVHREVARQEREGSPAMAKVAAMLQNISEAAIDW
ncbi:DUF302 domain-containing protein [Thiocystis violacea]|uniref:DUF302 domain-containing protein n=1 Tax=Thiocystis violacea TaxID=13725 RepID=UPI0019048B5A|nr:DUF302 domain-containing protein [Thiocystis violacea]MBK1719975.1 DUF302 domain-containing protein [Thiocystis violacea]